MDVEEKLMKIGIVGSNGFWSANIIKTLNKLNFEISSTCDLTAKSIDNIEHFTNIDEFLAATAADVIFVCTPPENHFETVEKCLNAKKHIWCEKPLTLDIKQADKLHSIADKQKKVLHVDNTWNYTPEYLLIKDGLKHDVFGKPISANLVWAANGRKQGCGVFWDLAPHVISQVFGWFGCPDYIRAFDYKENGISQSGNFILQYSERKSQLIINGEVSWLSPKKVRNTKITTEKGLVETNYDGQVFFHPLNGEVQIYTPNSFGSPLEVEINHFIESIKQNKQTLSNGGTGARIVELIGKIKTSLDYCGQEQRIH